MPRVDIGQGQPSVLGASGLSDGDDGGFVFRWGRSVRAGLRLAAAVLVIWFVRSVDGVGTVRAAAGGAVAAAGAAVLVVLGFWLAPAFNRLFPRTGSSLEPARTDGPDELAAGALAAWSDARILAAAWMVVLVGTNADAHGQRVGVPHPFDHTPLVLAVTEDHVLAATVRWPGPVVRLLGRWERPMVRAVDRLDGDVTLVVAGVGEVRCRPQNGTEQARLVRQLLTER